LLNKGLINVNTTIEGAMGNTSTDNTIALEEFLSRLEGTEFDKEVNANEAEAIIKKFTDLLKADLKAKYNFSDDFLDKIVEFAKKEVIKGCIKEKFSTDDWSANIKLYESGDNYWKDFYDENLNLKDKAKSGQATQYKLKSELSQCLQVLRFLNII
jgi:hypothetical protein